MITADEYLRLHGITQVSIDKFGLKDLGNMIKIPIKDADGIIIYHKYRNLDFDKNDPESKKYKFDPGHEAILFNSQSLINYKNYIFLCEGEIDCIRLCQEELLAVSGTAGAGTLKAEWIEKLKDKNIFLIFDNDKAGKEAAKTVAQKLVKAGAKVIIITLPDGCKDVCEFFTQGHTKNELITLIKEATEVKLERTNLNQLNKLNKIHWPSPLSQKAFYGLAGEIVRIIEPHSEADPVALLMNFLTAFGSVVGNKPHFTVEADKHPARLFIVLVGETSKARKGTSWGYIKQILGDIDPDWKQNIKTGLSSGEGLIWAVRDEIKKIKPVKQGGQIINYEEEITDEGIKDKRLLIVESEFASILMVINREGNTLSPIIREAWDSGDLQSLTKNSPAKATNAHISIIGHVTHQELIRHLNQTEIANGFGNRFLWICVKRSKPLEFGGEFQKVDLTHIKEKIIEAIFFSNNVDEITWSDEAKPIWSKVYPGLSEGKPGLVGSMAARAEAYVIRLASIYALLDLNSTIKPEHLEAALAVWYYVEESLKYIFQERTGDSLADSILDALESHPEGLTRTNISDLCSRHKNSEQISNSLDILEKQGLARKEYSPGEGRNTEIWFLERKGEESELG